MSLFRRRALVALLALSLLAVAITTGRKSGAASTSVALSLELLPGADDSPGAPASLTITADDPQKSVVAGFDFSNLDRNAQACQDFNQFANERLENSVVDSLVMLVNEWKTKQQSEEQIADLPPLEVNIDEKTLRSLVAAFPDVDDPEKLRAALGRRGGLTTAQMLAKAAALGQKACQE